MRYKIIQPKHGNNVEIVGLLDSQNRVIEACFAETHIPYLEWLKEGNVPEPYDGPPPSDHISPSIAEEIDALKVVVGMLMEGDDDV